jgi:hypothetical protein
MDLARDLNWIFSDNADGMLCDKLPRRRLEEKELRSPRRRLGLVFML